MNQNYLIPAVIAVVIFTLYMAVVQLFKRDKLRARMQASATPGNYTLDDDDDDLHPFAALAAGILKIVGVDVKAQKPLALLLQQAGIASPRAVTYFLFFKRIIQPVFGLIGVVLFVRGLIDSNLVTFDRITDFTLGLILLIIGISGANLYVTNRKQRRQQKLLYGFPEALDLLLVCIESGLGLDGALTRVCTELKHTQPEITQELERTRLELTILNDRTQALRNLGERAEIVPFKSLVASLLQTEKFGTSLLDTLRVLSEDQRVTRLLNAENKAARIPVLITIPLILCTLPVLFIVILAPPLIRVSDQGGIFGHSAQ